MKKLQNIWIRVCLVAAFSVLLLEPGSAPAAATRISNEEYITALVNHIRVDPLGYAERLGYNRLSLLQQLPWLSGALHDLDLLSVSDFLNQQATALNSTDPFATGPVITVNTDYASAGDVSGVVSFNNFMDPWEAIGIVINNQFKKELDPAYEGKRIIIGSEYKLIGTSFRAGRSQVRTGPKNAYYLFITFASSQLKSEVQVVNMINQLRANPSDSYKYLSLNTGFLSGGYGPLFLNDALASTARIGLSALIDILAHARYFGFPGIHVADSSVIETLPKADPGQLALWMFSSFILNEIKSYPARNGIFNPDWNEIGPALYNVSNPAYDHVKMTVVSGRTENQTPEVSRVYGVVFTDIDLNGVYTPGEEAQDRVISVYDMRTRARIRTVVTNTAGQFSLSLPNNVEYSIQTGAETNREGKLIFLTTDRYFDLVVKK
ncbi:MAG: hypothetical protein A2277_05815 [Desulfobacterales bacterium RIFOXYA12_FULL_46_15]|nr:MAG: hypothetical protein A2277_05815 [Desulfobacterales bacterium RIFOXYA12_FULL_46_15]